MKSNRQKQRFCHPKMADLKAWSYGVRKANCSLFTLVESYIKACEFIHTKQTQGLLQTSCQALANRTEKCPRIL